MKELIPSTPKEVRAMLEEKFGHPNQAAMSPYERVEAVMQGKIPDRVPFDFWAVPETIEKLQNYLQVDSEEEVLRLLGIDCRMIWPDYIGPELEKFDDGTFYNELGSLRKLVRNDFSTYEEYAAFPLAEAKTKAEVDAWEKWPKTEYWDWAAVPAQIDQINDPVRYHIRYQVGGIFESSWALYGLDKFLMDLMTNPEVPCAIMDKYTDMMIANVRSLAKVAGDKIDMVYTYDDVAIQNNLLMSPRVWRKHILPRHLRLNKVIKECGFKIMYHSCGAIVPLIEPLIAEMEIDVLNPLQPRAAGMDMQLIKDTYGKRIAFHGGIDLQHTLPNGTQQEVYDEVRERCEILGKDGGYIGTSAHYIQADVPVENIITLYTVPREV